MTLRVALDLNGALESLGNSMSDLASALEDRGGCELVRFRTLEAPRNPNERTLGFRALWSPLWRRGRGRAIDVLLGDVDVVHVAGLATPPTTSTPLVISVDDLRPLRREARTQQRVRQLQRAVDRGATLVASSWTALHEVQEVLSVARHQIVVVPPPVGSVAPTTNAKRLVVSVTGNSDRFFALAPGLVEFARRHHSDVVVVTSSALAARIKVAGIEATLVHRRNATEALAQARVVAHISDGARFPSFAIAALAAGVPTITRASAINRELLEGAATLVYDDRDTFLELEELWVNEARRSIAVAAGRDRARDFSPWSVAGAYVELYHDVAAQKVA